MGGGHAPGTGRRGTSEFPASWDRDRIMATILDVAKRPDERPRRLPNGRWRTAGTRDGVDVVVLLDAAGEVFTAYPTGGPGVTRNPDTAADPANPTLADLVAGGVGHFAAALLDSLADRLDAADLAHYRELHWSGEWEELADELAAHLTARPFPLDADERDHLRRLLTGFDTPLAGHPYLNDRDRVLAAVTPPA
ncbi:EndoU nuclease [Amycolatopsis arida]|uniref:EndoU nuclease n=1 Tax=Amycolatopsis arida TaxID=587909 RepID=A0A1I5TC72_9PSEU|nr:EndoU domain-containing protein [Amycolatopsis arida]TDX96148.1 EndoU nuclease-like protein [Amycolatopsis arida]SFP80630.1 EndoU nuclease [Amycolatopsis arida]